MFLSLCPLENDFRDTVFFTFTIVPSAFLFSFEVIEIIINNTIKIRGVLNRLTYTCAFFTCM